MGKGGIAVTDVTWLLQYSFKFGEIKSLPY